MLTGGFRTTSIMQDAVASNQVDVIGMARPFVLFPNIANDLLTEKQTDFTCYIQKTGVKAIDAAMNIIWYEAQIKRLGKGKKPNPKLNPWFVFLSYAWLIVAKRLF